MKRILIIMCLIVFNAYGKDKMNEAFNFEFFNETKHMLEWLHPEPFEAIKLNFEENLNQQVPGSVLLSLEVIDKPQWLTGAIPIEGDEGNARLKRVGVAFSFSLSARTPENIVHNIKGVYTWVGVNMDNREEEIQRSWVDIDGTLEEFGSEGALIQRVYLETIGAHQD